MQTPCVHIVGAGLAGLAAAVELVGAAYDVKLYEAAPQAGGRCRSYFDATLGLTIDNGNHLLLSGNTTAQAYLRRIGSADRLVGPRATEFPFMDLATGESWRLRPNSGPLPWWIFSPRRRVPNTRARDYLRLLPLLAARKGRALPDVLPCEGRLYERLWRPFFLAVLNTDPAEGSAVLAGAVVRETLAKGASACRPLVAEGLSAAFVDPALAYLAARGTKIRFDRRLRGLGLTRESQNQPGLVERLDFAEETVELGPRDKVILAVPAPVAASIVPNLDVPHSFRAIVNAHFKIAPPVGLPPILGLLNSTSEWLFAFPDRLSVTISGADRLLDMGREALAEMIWAEVARAAKIAAPLPTWQIIKEKRATFAATPQEEARRPGPRTRHANLLLAGDWTATGLPATIEGALRSGVRAAALVAAER